MSNNELKHYGVKGMKWGVWNEETRARYEGTQNDVISSSNLKKIDIKKHKVQNELDDIRRNGYKSAALIKRYPGIDTMSDWEFKYLGYGISKETALNLTETSLKNKIVRSNYRKKLLTGEEFTDEEKQLIKQDAIKTAVIVAAATGVSVYTAYKFGVFEKMHNNNSALSTIVEQSLDAGNYEQVIQQGFNFHRMSGWKNEDFSSRDAIYVSATEADRDIYKGFLKNWHKTGKRYEATLQAVKDIKVAGTNKQYEMLKELLEDNDYFDDFVQHFFIGDNSLITQYKGTYHDAIRREINRKGGEQFVKDHYKDVIFDLVKQDSSPAKKFLEKAKSMGYNALVDDFDRGTMSYTPLILIDPQDVVKQVGSTRVRTLEEGVAQIKTGARGILSRYYGFVLPDKAISPTV